MREQIPVTTALALPVRRCYLYTHILGPRDCRHPREGVPGAGLLAAPGSPRTTTISSLFCSQDPMGDRQQEGQQANVTIQETSESHEFCSRHVCAHTCEPAAGAG